MADAMSDVFLSTKRQSVNLDSEQAAQEIPPDCLAAEPCIECLMKMLLLEFAGDCSYCEHLMNEPWNADDRFFSAINSGHVISIQIKGLSKSD